MKLYDRVVFVGRSGSCREPMAAGILEDMICTSEVGVSVSIDDTKHLNEIVNDLKKYGIVNVDHDMCIICVVGDLRWENVGFEAKALDAMREIPVRMISFGGSDYNISFLVSKEDKKRALQSLSDHLFNN